MDKTHQAFPRCSSTSAAHSSRSLVVVVAPRVPAHVVKGVIHERAGALANLTVMHVVVLAHVVKMIADERAGSRAHLVVLVHVVIDVLMTFCIQSTHLFSDHHDKIQTACLARHTYRQCV